MNKEIAQKILKETETGYDAIAQKFSQTRKHFWRELEFIKEYTRENDNVLDFGCGNGRLLELIDQHNVNYFGVDVSEKLVEIAKSRYMGENVHFQKINPSQASLASEDGFFNSVYSIAVFHHFPSNAYRAELAHELYRVTKDGGHVIVTVWNLYQKKYFQNIWQNWLKKIKGQSELDWNDCEISFMDNAGTKIQRFHHAFTKRELRRLFETAGFQTEKYAIINGRNIIYIGKK